MSGADQVMALALDFDKAAAEIVPALFEVYKQQGEAFAEEWKHDAEGRFDGHAKRYPGQITSEAKVSTDIVIQTGPETSPAGRQGWLGRVLEFGGEHSPAYLDGLHAMQHRELLLERAADATIGHLLP